jgi:hypothetical protein
MYAGKHRLDAHWQEREMDSTPEGYEGRHRNGEED